MVVTGSRDDDGSRVAEDLADLKRKHGRLRVAHGGARGADAAAGEFARGTRRVKERVYPADWSEGRSAGPRRNRRMIDAERPDVVLAYPSESGRGTQDAMRYARKRGHEVIVREPVGKADVPLPEMTAEERRAFVDEKKSEARTRRIQAVLSGTGASMAATGAALVAAGKTRKMPRTTEAGMVLGSAAGGFGAASGMNFARNEMRGAKKADKDRERAMEQPVKVKKGLPSYLRQQAKLPEFHRSRIGMLNRRRIEAHQTGRWASELDSSAKRRFAVDEFGYPDWRRTSPQVKQDFVVAGKVMREGKTLKRGQRQVTAAYARTGTFKGDPAVPPQKKTDPVNPALRRRLAARQSWKDVSKAKSDPEPGRRARVRAVHPSGDEWRKHVSSGAARAYDGPLEPSAKEAKALAKKGRLVAAHKREKGRYRIRVRGYDRKYRPEEYEEVGKAVKQTAQKIGPYSKKVTEIRLKKPSKAERRTEVIRAVGSSIGGTKVAAGAAGGVAASEWWDKTKKGAKAAKERSKQAIHEVSGERAESKVGKSLTIDDILANRIAKADEVSLSELQEIHKGFLQQLKNTFAGTQTGQLGQRYVQAFRQGGANGAGMEGSLNATQKVAQETGGAKGIGQALWNDAGTIAANPNAHKGAAAVAGLGAAGYGAYRAGKWGVGTIKAKAKKAALYGGGALVGTSVAGGYLGSKMGGN